MPRSPSTCRRPSRFTSVQRPRSVFIAAPCVAAVCLAIVAGAEARAAGDLATRLTQATFRLVSQQTQGTVFFLEHASPGRDSQTLLVTANHVLEKTEGDEVSLILRRAKDDGYERVPTKLQIRQQGRALWARHPTADVAVMKVKLALELLGPKVSTELLATDERLSQLEIRPGELVRCLGYPHAGQFETGESGFAVTRLGAWSSFPILPTRKPRTFLVDFNVFEGDSGGPVYLEDDYRRVEGADRPERAQLILGVVHGQHFIDEQYRMIYQSGHTRHRMGLAIVTHATAVRETIELLPAD